ncbi:hypothetical protein BD413DRAFT_510316 [Trametes elegans]|nr:hypothetical protein BD413DRAFT_510316 [Trametes elegans]
MLDFVPLRGRGARVYCKLCTPPKYDHGQPMTRDAALRHERENAKHQEKVAEEARWHWEYQEKQPDWVAPQGESAWEWDPTTSERLKAYVQFWLDGIAAHERGEKPQKMDAFISRYDKAYEAEVWEGKVEEQEEEWPLDVRDGVEGYWYAGGSFDPCDEGFEQPDWWDGSDATWTSRKTPAAWEDPEEEERRWREWHFGDIDAKKLWDLGDNYVWDANAWAPNTSHPSDATTPTQQSAEKATAQRSGRRRGHRGGRGRGRGRSKQVAKGEQVPGQTRPVRARRGQPQRAGVH